MSTRNLYQKMTDIMKEVDTVFKGANIQMAGGRSYSAVNHDDVARLLHKPLAEHGVWTKVSVERVELNSRDKTNKYGDVSLEYRADVWVEVTFINADKPEEREICKGFAYAFDSSDKAVGKAESMAVKYIFLKNFTLESTDNEESRDHENNTKPSQPVRATTAPIKAIETQINNAAAKATEQTTVAATPAATANRGSFRRNTTPSSNKEL